MALLEYIKQLDQQLLILVNCYNTPFWDDAMLLLTDKLVWIPMYLLFIYVIFKRLGSRDGFVAILGALLLIYYCDRISVVFFKDVFKRYRPCHNTILMDVIHTVKTYCGGKHSFVSSHATNSFGLAAYIATLVAPKKFWIAMLFLWATLVAYTRVYLAVHYPLDIIGGAIVGTMIGLALGWVINYYFISRKTFMA